MSEALQEFLFDFLVIFLAFSLGSAYILIIDLTSDQWWSRALLWLIALATVVLMLILFSKGGNLSWPFHDV